MKRLIMLCLVFCFLTPCHAMRFMTNRSAKNLPAYEEQRMRRIQLQRERERQELELQQERERRRILEMKRQRSDRAFQKWLQWDDHSKNGFRRFVHENNIAVEDSLMIIEFENKLGGFR